MLPQLPLHKILLICRVQNMVDTCRLGNRMGEKRRATRVWLLQRVNVLINIYQHSQGYTLYLTACKLYLNKLLKIVTIKTSVLPLRPVVLPSHNSKDQNVILGATCHRGKARL